MGEIKSTLDLVMERTRHLTLSNDEKSAQEAQEQQQRIQGLIQRYQDQTLTFNELERKLAKDFPADFCKHGGVLYRELLHRIDITNSNETILFLLKSLCGVDPAPWATLLDEFSQGLSAKQDEYAARQLKMLADRHGIRGSALIPNLEQDPEWQTARGALIERYQDRLNQIG